MSTFIDPFTSTKIQRPPRKSGRVTITGKLVPDPESLVPFPCELPLRVTFQRQDLTEALRAPLWQGPADKNDRSLGQDRFFRTVTGGIVTALANTASFYPMDADDLSTFRKQEFRLTPSVPISKDRTFRYCVTVPQWLFGGDGHQVKRFFEQNGSFTGLTSELHFTLFPPNVQRLLLCSPRGRKANAKPLLECVPVALFLATQIIKQAVLDPMLDAKIAGVLKEAPDLAEYVSHYAGVSRAPRPVKATAAALVNQGFQRNAERDAWVRYGVKRLLEFESPKEVFRHHLSGATRRRVILIWRAFTPEEQRMMCTQWAAWLLGPPGQAALALGFLR